MSPRALHVAAALAFAWAGPACGARPSQMPPGGDVAQFVIERRGESGLPGAEWRPDVCARVDLEPEYQKLDETSLVAFLGAQHLEARVARQPVEPGQPALVFVFVSGVGSATAATPVTLRVAVLPTADDAGRALHEALVRRGDGAWGVHRSNLAALGPVGRSGDDLAFAAESRLACWGVMTLADSGDVLVVPGGYAEP